MDELDCPRLVFIMPRAAEQRTLMQRLKVPAAAAKHRLIFLDPVTGHWLTLTLVTLTLALALTLTLALARALTLALTLARCEAKSYAWGRRGRSSLVATLACGMDEGFELNEAR